MANQNFLKTLNLEFSGNVPRTEYSVEKHWQLIKKVTGIDTDILANREEGARELVRKWDYSFKWRTSINRQWLQRNGGRCTSMGHAAYSESASGNSDFKAEIQNPFADINDAFALDPLQEYGDFSRSEIISHFQSKYQEAEKLFPSALNTGGIYITLVSGLLEIYGWDTFLMLIGLDEEKLGKIIEKYFIWIKQFYDAFAQTDLPVLMSHDDICWTSGPFTSPAWYRKWIFPFLKKLWEPVKASGKKIIYTSDGNYTEFFDDIVDCGADMLVMEPCADMELFVERYGNTHGFVGNADCRILLSGTKEDIEKEVKRCMDIGKKYPGFVMAVGNHIPPNTPVDNALWYNDLYLKMRKR